MNKQSRKQEIKRLESEIKKASDVLYLIGALDSLTPDQVAKVRKLVERLENTP